MSTNKYCNFVVPSTAVPVKNLIGCPLSGDEVKRLYVEEISNSKPSSINNCKPETLCITKKKQSVRNVTDSELFVVVENNDIAALCDILDNFPDKLNVLDSYGWSLLMIACQANSVEIVQELLKRGIDINIRDKAGNSAKSLVISNKNMILADIFLSYNNLKKPALTPKDNTHPNLETEYRCEMCDSRLFPDKQRHLSSIEHNINASKGKKIPTNYVIPVSNKGYQIMLKVGWDKESGLGPNGTGMKYPIKTQQKKDKKGLGHEKRKLEVKEEIVKCKNRRLLNKESYNNRNMEINFRRQFY